MAFFTETPDAIFDVIDGGLDFHPSAFVPFYRRAPRKWKLKDLPSTCGDTVLLLLRDFERSLRGSL